MLLDDIQPGRVIRFPSTGKSFEVASVNDGWIMLKEIGGRDGGEIVARSGENPESFSAPG